MSGKKINSHFSFSLRIEYKHFVNGAALWSNTNRTLSAVILCWRFPLQIRMLILMQPKSGKSHRIKNIIFYGQRMISAQETEREKK